MDDENDPRTDAALHRYGLVSELIHRSSGRRGVDRHLREVASRSYRFPSGDKAKFGVSTLYRYLKKAREQGLKGLKRKVRRDKGNLKAFGPDLLQEIIRRKEEDPKLSVPVIIDLLVKEDRVPKDFLRPTTVRRQLREKGLGNQKKPDFQAFGRFERRHPNELWLGDISPGPALPPREKGRRALTTQLFVWIDDHSRYLVGARYFPTAEQPALDESLKRAILLHGVPAGIFCDNGKVYVSNHFRRVVAELKIHPIYSTPYYPPGKGKVERIIQTIQQGFERPVYQLIKNGTIQTLEDLNRHLSLWVAEYQMRKHSSTGVSPKERFGEPQPPANLREIEEIFLWRERRKVLTTGEVLLFGNRYEVPDRLVGQLITIYYQPYELQRVFLKEENSFLPLRPSGPQKKTRHPGLKKPPEQKVNESVYLVLLQEALGRELSSEEIELLRQELRRPDLGEPVEVSRWLSRFVERSGRDLHLLAYLYQFRR